MCQWESATRAACTQALYPIRPDSLMYVSSLCPYICVLIMSLYVSLHVSIRPTAQDKSNTIKHQTAEPQQIPHLPTGYFRDEHFVVDDGSLFGRFGIWVLLIRFLHTHIIHTHTHTNTHNTHTLYMYIYIYTHTHTHTQTHTYV